MAQDIIDRLNELSRVLLEPEAELVRNAADEIDRLRQPERDAKAAEFQRVADLHRITVEDIEEIAVAYRDALEAAASALASFMLRPRKTAHIDDRFKDLVDCRDRSFVRMANILHPRGKPAVSGGLEDI